MRLNNKVMWARSLMAELDKQLYKKNNEKSGIFFQLKEELVVF